MFYYFLLPFFSFRGVRLIVFIISEVSNDGRDDVLHSYVKVSLTKNSRFYDACESIRSIRGQ